MTADVGRRLQADVNPTRRRRRREEMIRQLGQTPPEESPDGSAVEAAQEFERISVGRSWWSVKGHLFLLFVFGLFGTWISVMFSESILYDSLELLGIAIPLFLPLGFIPLVLFGVKTVAAVYDSYMIIGRRHLRLVSGVFAVKRKQKEIPYESILFVQVDQNIWERLFGIGSISVGRNLDNKEEIVLPGICKPYIYADLIRERIGAVRGSNEYGSPQYVH